MRALVIILDSLGIGEAPDAADFGDLGSATLQHILDASPNLNLPTLWELGLGNIIQRQPHPNPRASFGIMTPRSAGKDSTVGHWELAGVITPQPLGLFERFPAPLIDAIEAEAGVCFIGNYPASGTQIIEDLGPEHIRTRGPILYTSADSVLQIAAHEEILPIEDLYRICRIARKHADPYRIGRVIARPFVGQPGAFKRTANRHDFSLQPPPTILNALADRHIPITAVGKTFDLFAGSGFSDAHPTTSNAHGMQTIARLWTDHFTGLLFANLGDFDAVFGHRRNAPGYAAALSEFDAWLADFLPRLNPDDLLIITADHGNDPTFRGTDHTRERVPILLLHHNIGRALGLRESFADLAATLADYFKIPPWPIGASMLAPTEIPRAQKQSPRPGAQAWPADERIDNRQPEAPLRQKRSNYTDPAR